MNKNANGPEVQKLEIGQRVNVEAYGVCNVEKLAWNGIITMHYFVTTPARKVIRINWNPLTKIWVQYSQH